MKSKTNPAEQACAICGSTNFEWGKLTSNGGVWYAPEADSVSGGIFGGKRLAVRLCLECGNVQIFLQDVIGAKAPVSAETSAKSSPKPRKKAV